MPQNPSSGDRLRERRQLRQWSQADLAERAGISRTGVSAIEGDRLVPSVTAALALAQALECTVEDLFGATDSDSNPTWAWPPAGQPSRYWLAEVRGRVLAFPGESTLRGELPHDGLSRESTFGPIRDLDPGRTLVVAGCDPAAGLLASEYERDGRFRMLPILRSSRQALELLTQGLVHVAGMHLAASGSSHGNSAVVRQMLGGGFRLLRLAEWEEGIAVAPGGGHRSVKSLVRSKLRWVGREPGSGARQCLDELFGETRPLRRIATDHRGVAAAIRGGWADAGICLRLASDEAGLEFRPLRWESYDLCFPADLEDDPRLKALVSVVRERALHRLFGDLPGYDVKHTGELAAV